MTASAIGGSGGANDTTFYFRSLTQYAGKLFFPLLLRCIPRRVSFAEGISCDPMRNEEEQSLEVKNEKPTDMCASAGPVWILPEQVDWWQRVPLKKRNLGMT